jgi:hypothetical protein
VIERMMAKEPALRYQTPGDVVAALEPWSQPGAETIAPPPQVTAARGRLRGRRTVAVIVGSALILVAATMASLWFGRGEPKKDERGEPRVPAVRPGDPAPDLSKVLPLIDDDFSDQRTSQFPTFWHSNSGAESHFENRQLTALLAGNIVGSRSGNSLTSIVSVGCAVDPSVSSTSCEASLARYVLRTGRAKAWKASGSPGIVVEGDFACEVVGRVLRKGDPGWGIFLAPLPPERRVPAIRLLGDRSVEVGTFSFDRDTLARTAGPIRHQAIESSDRFNRLLVVVRGGQSLEVYVNGVAISGPIQLERRLSARFYQDVTSWSRHAEFRRFRLWLLRPPGPAPLSGEGSRPPDLSKEETFIDADFSTPAARRWFPEQRDDPGERYEKGLYVIRKASTVTPPNARTHSDHWRRVGDPSTGDVACQVEGRVLSGGDHGWAVGFSTPEEDRSVGVRLRRDGAVEVGDFFINQAGPVTTAGPIRHKAIRPGNEFNTVLAVLRGGRRLEVHVNGSPICAPIQLEQPLSLVHAGIQQWARGGHYELKGRAEFRRFTVWRLSR